MTDRGLVFGILFVMAISLVVILVELFLPVSKKIEMDIDCRGTMLKMELDGGLSSDVEDRLRMKMSRLGLTNIAITGSPGAKQGNELRLRVEADYAFSRFSSIFAREETNLRLVYDRTTIARRVLN